MPSSTTDMFLRLRCSTTDSYYFVDSEGGQVRAASDAGAAQRARALASARKYAGRYARPVPGTLTPDGRFEVRGALAQDEQRALHDGRELRRERSALELHLDFFDLDLNGRITLRESYRAWRGLGFGAAAAALKALLAALIFGRWLVIDCARIHERRRAGTTGIYDPRGHADVDIARTYMAEFDRAGGRLTFDALVSLLDQGRAHGRVSRGQFRSLFAVCRRMNGDDSITAEQFVALFDGSLLWLAASLPGSSGRRASWLQAVARSA